MRTTSPARPTRTAVRVALLALAGAAAAVGALALALGVGQPALVRLLSGRAEVTDLVTAAAAAGLALLALWWALAWAVALAGAASRALGRPSELLDHLARRTAPALVRRAAGLGLGVAVATGALGATAPSALAATGSPGSPAATTPAAGTPDPLAWPTTGAPTPTPTATATPTPTPTPTSGPATARPSPSARQRSSASPTGPHASPTGPDASQPPSATRVVVAPGDTLWSIAAEHLPTGAPAARPAPGRSASAAVAAAWPRWWAANRAVIGDDPDLLHPGEVLTAPASTDAPRSAGPVAP